MAHPPLDNPKWERFAQDPDCKGSTKTEDERAIRELVDVWLAASKAGDLQTILSLITDDVIFMVPGRRPFGKEAFAAASQGMQNVTMEGMTDIQEIQVLGDWAYLRNYIEMVATPPLPSLHCSRRDQWWRSLTPSFGLLALAQNAMASAQAFCHCSASCIQNCMGF